MKTVDNYKHFTETCYSGRKLLENHSLKQHGIWKIQGEDPNCDMGGSHYQPELGIVEGKLEDVIRYAVELPNFWTWGGGGDITLIPQPKKIDGNSVARRAELLKRKDELEKELKQINSELT
jgi:hypothetical protein